MTATESKIDTVRERLLAQFRELDGLSNIATSFDKQAIHISVGAQYDLHVQLLPAPWRLGFADGVQIVVRAPSSRWSWMNQWFVNQSRTFRTGKDGEKLNLAGINKAVQELGAELHAADRKRRALADDEEDQEAAREANRAALVDAKLLPATEPEFGLPVHSNAVHLPGGVEARLSAGLRGVSLEIKGATAAQIIDLLRRIK